MKAAITKSKLSKFSKFPLEDGAFWKNHAELYQSSGLTRMEYCRSNNLDYPRFGYWIKKCLQTPPTLLPVRLTSSDNPPPPIQHILCTLNFANGCSLKIHDSQALSIILERMG
jgi:hypothetical protein